MGEDNRIEVRFPKGKMKPKHIAIIVVFALFIWVMCETLESVFSTGLANPNYATFTISLILLVIGAVSVYLVRLLSRGT